jgi:hypothetical protein
MPRMTAVSSSSTIGCASTLAVPATFTTSRMARISRHSRTSDWPAQADPRKRHLSNPAKKMSGLSMSRMSPE